MNYKEYLAFQKVFKSVSVSTAEIHNALVDLSNYVKKTPKTVYVLDFNGTVYVAVEATDIMEYFQSNHHFNLSRHSIEEVNTLSDFTSQAVFQYAAEKERSCVNLVPEAIR